MKNTHWKLIRLPLYVVKCIAEVIALLLLVVRALLVKAWKLAIIAAIAFLVTWVLLQAQYDRAHGFNYSPVDGRPTYAK
jgi:isoprenylcysteine carboxyl methyltransferase (ICMT) family protein YpbQ